MKKATSENSVAFDSVARLPAALGRLRWIIGLVNAVANPSSAEPPALLPPGVIHANLARHHGFAILIDRRATHLSVCVLV